MKNFTASLLVLLSFILFTSCKSEKGNRTNPIDSLQVHKNALTIDTHIDIPIKLVRDSTYKLSERHTYKNDKTRTDIPRMKDGGLDAAFFIVWTAQGERTEIGNKIVKEKALNIISTINRSVKESENAQLANSTEDIVKICDLNMHAILMGMENGYPIGNDIKLVEEFYNLGIRYITLCHTKDNDICDSSTDESDDEGVTDFGVEVIKEMNRLGIIIDVSHISDSSFYQVLQLSKVPVIASHSNVRSLCEHPRNMSDDMIIQLAKNGGVIHVNFVPEYILVHEPNSAEKDSAIVRLKDKYDFNNITDEERMLFHTSLTEINKKHPTPQPTLDDLVDHIDYIVNLVGINHVGIGSDFDGGGGVKGFNEINELPNITKELLKRKYSIEDIEKIWSGNFMRVFKEVEKFAEERQQPIS